MVSRAVSGCVYFITTAEADRVKIGFTKNDPSVRMKELQTGSPFELCIIGVERGSVSHERELHNRFYDYRLHGEWFKFSAEIREYVKELNRRHFAEAQEKQFTPPYWVRVFNAIENGATVEEANFV